ncbi:gamma-glutamyltranspeptidase [Steroidobacter agaridevorans]|uniref:Glutathione hydrolase proenzyme n=1 Tax=Steroidobacter agaridevorans TaxID=2695856 RepID=A0A829YC90_9GAMM|nr:gamma-glutamyltransferase [Steroidobacter agaridevorans]GFE80879.1 gamma-glutamyltranspeptidase [Steroidobacter agaridevorans]
MKVIPLLRVRVLLVALFVLPLAALADQPERPGKAGIASAHQLATEAGMEILRQGGNAFDAAVAVSAALAVVEPSSSGLGGGAFWLLHRASDGFETMVDAREVAPRAATHDMFLDEKGDVVKGRSTSTALAAGIPGEPAGFQYVSKTYGKLPFKTVLQPAIRLARDGFPLNNRLRGGIVAKRETFNAGAAAKIFLDKGQVPAVGFIIKQPELAKTLTALAERGSDGFYKGPVAKQLVDGVKKMGGIWSLQDLAEYQVKERKPVVGEYQGARIVTAPPPSSGGVGLVNALNILSGYDLKTVDDATRVHLIVEAARRVHRDRAEYLGDPDFVNVPMERLLSPHYAAGQRASIRMDRATPSDSLPSIAPAPVGTQTTHFSIIDADGNRVSGTMSINFFFGSGLMVPGVGILLNNEMDDFVAKAGVPNGFRLVGAESNAIAPGKRPLSSMTPTFVERPEGVMVLGTPGGSYIMGMVLLATLDWMQGMSPDELVKKGRFHHQYMPDVLSFEPGALNADVQATLKQFGHNLRESRQPGNMQIVTWDYKTGAVKAISDPRGVGVGVVY